jgi:hypothetical protein
MKLSIWCMALAFLLNCANAAAVETRIIVRALAKDAKFIGTSMDGAVGPGGSQV